MYQYRVWDKKSKVMNTALCVDFAGVYIRKGQPSYIAKEDHDGCWLLEDGVMLKYTPCQDINKKYVCEGDIFIYHHKESGKKTVGKLVEDRFGLLAFNNAYNDMFEEWSDVVRAVYIEGLATIEVIGDIYRTPELEKAINV